MENKCECKAGEKSIKCFQDNTSFERLVLDINEKVLFQEVIPGNIRKIGDKIGSCINKNSDFLNIIAYEHTK